MVARIAELALGECVERAVAHDLEQPAREPRRLAAVVEPLERGNERLLGDVLGIGRSPEHGERDREGRA